VIVLSPRQRGDFQTPTELARQVWSTIEIGQYNAIIEPTFGLGSFLKTMPRTNADVIGWEIDEEYFRLADKTNLRLELKDVFDVTRADIKADPTSRILVIGNPPWVTNSEQSSLGGLNTGAKRNLKSLSGLAAKTGKANYDISEAIILHLVRLLEHCELVQFALLGKFKVLRNLMEFVGKKPGVGNFEFHRIDSKKYFNAAVDAGLIKFQTGSSLENTQTCTVYGQVAGAEEKRIAIVDNRLIFDVNSYQQTAYLEHEGEHCYVWRQGIKHDVQEVMELIETDSGVLNRLGQVVEVEEELLYRLYKSSDIYNGRESRFVTPIYQRDLKDNLEDLETRYPKLYKYLSKHKDRFKDRKSSIYRSKSTFAVFGIGAYTHLPYKVIVAGMYQEPRFKLVGPSPRPAMPDDTGYMLATDSLAEAIYLLAFLTLDSVHDFLLAISHVGDKRRFSKEVLSRLRIPSVGDVPDDLLRELVKSWNEQKSFTREQRVRLQTWIENFQPCLTKHAYQGSLF